MSHPAACRLTALGLGLVLTGLAALPAQATPALQTATSGVAAPVLPDAQPVLAGARPPGPAPRPAADPPGSESLWFVGVFQ